MQKAFVTGLEGALVIGTSNLLWSHTVSSTSLGEGTAVSGDHSLPWAVFTGDRAQEGGPWGPAAVLGTLRT